MALASRSSAAGHGQVLQLCNGQPLAHRTPMRALRCLLRIVHWNHHRSGASRIRGWLLAPVRTRPHDLYGRTQDSLGSLILAGACEKLPIEGHLASHDKPGGRMRMSARLGGWLKNHVNNLHSCSMHVTDRHIQGPST